jgi:hypothetical protein
MADCAVLGAADGGKQRIFGHGGAATRTLWSGFRWLPGRFPGDPLFRHGSFYG